MGQKLALIIGNSEYQDANLARLLTPNEDVNDLAEVLRAPGIGNFDHVTTLVNETDAAIRLNIEDFFADKSPDDLLIMYFSGHGVRDEQGKLYLAVNNTRANRLRATAIPAEFITSEMDRSRSKRQVLILDCCHSGAFAQGSKAMTGESVGIGPAFEGNGYGRVVLTATDATQYAWEGDQIIGQADNSVFTHYMIEGLKSGSADTDNDGRITVGEIYDYVYGQVVAQTPKQTPGKWSYRQQGEMVIAQNLHPRVKPIDLPIELQQSIDDSRPWVRASAIGELERLLLGRTPALADAAYAALKRLAEDDSRKVAATATQSLNIYEARLKTEAERDRLEQERLEAGRLAAQQAEAARLAQEKIERERASTEQAEQERIAKEKVAQQRLAEQKTKQAQIARQRAEQERLAQQRAEEERRVQEKAQPEQQAVPAAMQSTRGRKVPKWIWIVGSVLILGAVVALVAIQTVPKPASLAMLKLAQSEWHLVFGDSFDASTDHWSIGTVDNPNDATVNQQIVNGKYRWEMKAHRDFGTTTSVVHTPDANFYASVDARQLEGAAACNYGLMLRASDAGLYQFSLSDSDSQFFVSAYDNNNQALRWLVGPSESAAIHPGEVNKLSVIAEGGHYRFFINDQPVGEMTDDQWSTGDVELSAQLCKAGDSAIIEFDNIELRAP